jgi:hypothetical protein
MGDIFMKHNVKTLPKWAREKILNLEREVGILRKHPITLIVYDTVVFKREALVHTPEGIRLETHTYNLACGDSFTFSHREGVGEQLLVVQWGKQPPH